MSGLYGGSPSQSGYRRDNTNAGGIPPPPAGLGGRFPPIPSGGVGGANAQQQQNIGNLLGGGGGGRPNPSAAPRMNGGFGIDQIQQQQQNLSGLGGGNGLGGGSSFQQGGPQQGYGAPARTASFDASDFPSLGGGGQGPYGDAYPPQYPQGSGYDGFGVDGHVGGYYAKPPPEFAIEQEDFPALGGMGGGGGGPRKPSDAAAAVAAGVAKQRQQQQQQHQQQQQQQQIGSGGVGNIGGVNRIFSGGAQGGGIEGNNDLGMQQQRQPNFDAGGGFGMGNSRGGYNGQDLLRQSSSQSSNSVVQQTANMDPNDRYGLMGLLNVIRMTDPNMTTLALGTDLTMLGLNLNSSEPLYTNFSPPWLTDATPKHELELLIPACYNQHTAGRAHPAMFSKFQHETLFYIFYSMPGEEAQLYAADELIHRGWGFHKEIKAWLMRVQGTEPTSKTDYGERGAFWVFDVQTWERVRKDNFMLSYDQLENRPQVAATQ